MLILLTSFSNFAQTNLNLMLHFCIIFKLEILCLITEAFYVHSYVTLYVMEMLGSRFITSIKLIFMIYEVKSLRCKKYYVLMLHF